MKVAMQEIIRVLTDSNGQSEIKNFLNNKKDVKIKLDSYDTYIQLSYLGGGIGTISIMNQTTEHYAMVGDFKTTMESPSENVGAVGTHHFTDLILELISKPLFREVLKDHINPKCGRVGELRKIMTSCAKQVTPVCFDNIKDQATMAKIMGVWRRRFLHGEVNEGHFISINRLNRE